MTPKTKEGIKYLLEMPSSQRVQFIVGLIKDKSVKIDDLLGTAALYYETYPDECTADKVLGFGLDISAAETTIDFLKKQN